ncbi:MAG: DUF5693 family protein [Bacillota bacterium]
MYKKFLVTLIIIAVLAGLMIAYQRWQLEQDDRSVELILDLEQLQQLSLLPKQDLTTLLEKYRSLGVTSLAINEVDLADLQQRGRITLLSASELDILQRAADQSLFSRSQFKESSRRVYISVLEEGLADQLEEWLTEYLGAGQVSRINQRLLAVESSEEQLLQLPVGFTAQQLKLARQSGLKIVPRFSNRTAFKSTLIKKKFSTLAHLPTNLLSQVLFTGTEVVGYPKFLATTADLIEQYDLQLGIIEPFIADQQGVNQLAVQQGIESLRVHSITQEEMTTLSIASVADRYLRAVRERSVRGVYLKPFLSAKSDKSAVEATTELVTTLATRLKVEEYRLQKAIPLTKFSSSRGLQLLINLGVLAALFYLVEYLVAAYLPFRIPVGYKIIFFLSLALLLALTVQNYLLLNRELTAFLTALIFPVLAVITSLAPYLNYQTTEQNQSKFTLLAVVARITLITFSGVILLIASLADWHYLLQIRRFRGVKLAFIAPVLLVGIYYLYRSTASISSLKDVLTRQLEVKDLLILVGLASLGLLYITRTGNQSIIPILDVEVLMRRWLEDILLVRPRFKAFLIGHPLLVYGSWLLIRKNRSRNWGLGLISAGVIGQITIINTFSHLHTPLQVSLLRAGLGLILGVVIGLMMIWLDEELVI